MGKVVPGRVFDPIAGFMAMKMGDFQEGITRVYANSVLEKLKTGQFHLLQGRNRQRARLLREKSKEPLSEDFFMRKP